MSTPYADHGHAYLTLGWAPLPLPIGEKHPPPTGWTGYAAPYPSGPEVQEWLEAQPAANIGLRMPETVLGIDLDAYGDKPGLPTLMAAIDQHGQLPTTYRSTSRDADNPSGIRFYRVPAGRRWANVIGPGVEVIHHGARYAVAAPSLHPSTGNPYRWHNPDGEPCDPPKVADLPELPQAWVTALDRGDAADRGEKADLLPADVTAWLDQRAGGPTPCRYLERVLTEGQTGLAAATSRHDAALTAVGRIIRGADQGHDGAANALDTYRALWLDALRRGESRTPSTGEWERLVAGAVALTVARPTPEADRGCCGPRDPHEVTTLVSEPIPVTGTPATAAKALHKAHAVFTRWLGNDYDLDAIDATLAAAAVERLDGDPLWLLLVSGSGNAKTETVQALDGIGATVASTIASEGALLSATSKRERSTSATGGLLRQIGDRGVLVIKDVTSILSMSRDQRGQVLGAMREVYDGRWNRSVGTDGGRTLSWEGRIVLVGAVTTAWDTAHAVVAAMGDRFVLLRMDSTTGRQVAGRKAIGNTGHEVQMRAELAAAVATVVDAMTSPEPVTVAETDVLLAAADLVTLARTGVEYDYRGDVIDAHAPEMPTRFAKQLA